MSKYKSIVSIRHIEPGDIVQYPTQGPLVERQKQPFSYGYVHHVVYDDKDDVIGLDILPVTSRSQANEKNARYHSIHAEEIGNALGLPKNIDWAIHFSLTKLKANELGESPTIQRIGKVGHTNQHIIIQNQIENYGEDKIYYPHRSGYAKPSPAAWGVYAPVGISKLLDDNESQLKEPPKKRTGKRKNAEGAKILDIDFKNAVGSFGFNKDTANAFEHPQNKKLPPLKGMRDLFTLVTNSPEKIGQYLPNQDRIIPAIALDSIPDKIPAILSELLATPLDDAPARIKPISNLRDAMDLVKNRPEDLRHYYLFDSTPELRGFMEIVFPKIVDEISPPEDNTEATNAVISHIKSVWAGVGAGYLHSIKTGNPKPEHQNENGEAVWKLIPKI